LDKKKEGRKNLYLVKWEGFEEKDATWEPLANLGNVKELIKEFDRQFDLQANGNQQSTNLTTNLMSCSQLYQEDLTQ
jgi:hypothetical protein